jgi:hypothetical protein
MHKPARNRTRISRRQLAAVGLTAALAGTPTLAEVNHEFLFFPSVDGFDTFSESDASVKDSSTAAGLDLLYSFSGNRFRFLGEFLWSSDEAEFERLQAGVRVADDAFVWAGRFHAPAKFWTSEYHHGQYLQTSITRPALEEWEDDGGATPAHITGLLLESEHQRSDESSFGLAASIGYAPVLEDGQLETHELFESASDHGLSLNFRVAYRPEYLSSTQFGLLAGWNEIKVQTAAIPLPDEPLSIDQAMVGAFGDWYWDRLRLLASIVYFDHTLRRRHRPGRFGLPGVVRSLHHRALHARRALGHGGTPCPDRRDRQYDLWGGSHGFKRFQRVPAAVECRLSVNLRRRYWLFVGAAWFLAGAAASADSVVLITGEGCPVDDISALDVRKAYLGVTVRADGSRLTPILMRGDDKLEGIFYQSVVAMSKKSYERRRLSLALKYGTPRLDEVDELSAVSEALRREECAITYMWEHDAETLPGVKTIRLLWQDT